MRRIKYIKSDKFFAKEYKDGIIVAFKNIGDNNSSYADQIHQIVSKNFGVDLFVSDIIESISEVNSNKDSIKDSLFIYVKNGVSISACGISLCLNKDYIEVKYYSEKVLTVQKKNSKRLWCVCILVLLCICGYNTIFEDYIMPDDPMVEIHEEVITEPIAPIETIISNNYKKDESEQDDKADENIVEVVETDVAKDEEVHQDVVTTPIVPEDFIPIPTVEAKVQREREDAERDRHRKALKAEANEEANEYVRIADQAYIDYADSFNESKGIVALTNYKKALDLNKKHGLFIVSERERIEQKVNILEEELK